jgi:hypothetical protein
VTGGIRTVDETVSIVVSSIGASRSRSTFVRSRGIVASGITRITIGVTLRIGCIDETVSVVVDTVIALGLLDAQMIQTHIIHRTIRSGIAGSDLDVRKGRGGQKRILSKADVQSVGIDSVLMAILERDGRIKSKAMHTVSSAVVGNRISCVPGRHDA